MLLNYRYRLYPTPEQAKALSCSMRLMRRGWNEMVKLTRQCRKKGHRPASQIRSRLVQQVLKRGRTGRRVEAMRKLIAAGAALTPEQAIEKLNAKQIERVNELKKSALAVRYAREVADQHRKDNLVSDMGAPWTRLSKKFEDAWKACWDRKRKRPRKTRDANWICVGVLGGKTPFLRNKPNGHNENLINLSAVLQKRYRGNAAICHSRCIQHRPLPADAVVKDLKVIRSSKYAHAEWYVVIALETEEAARREYAATGLACGIDPGLKAPLTVAGENHLLPGQDGFEIDPGRPFHKCRQKLARLQRKYDRQVHANNPQCFDEAGRWKKGCKIENVSKGMLETREQIAKLYSRAANIRIEVYRLDAGSILNQYDTVYIGDWKDHTPEQKGQKRRERKKAFAKAGIKRAKGQAAQERTRNRVSLDNAPGLFRQILNEKASRSVTPKQIEICREAGTTRQCPPCHEITGPTGVSGLSARVWKCPACGSEHKRDRASAWNILQAGRQMRRSAGGACPDATQAKTRKASRPGTDGRKAPTPRSRSKASGRVLESRSSGNLVARTPSPLASGARHVISAGHAATGDSTDVDRATGRPGSLETTALNNNKISARTSSSSSG